LHGYVPLTLLAYY